VGSSSCQTSALCDDVEVAGHKSEVSVAAKDAVVDVIVVGLPMSSCT
jgi:hypothetical protein